MHEETRLPRKGKESLLFLGIISILSVNIIPPLIMGFRFGLSKEIYVETLRVIPFVWIYVILLVTLVANPIVNKLVQKFIEPTTVLMQVFYLQYIQRNNSVYVADGYRILDWYGGNQYRADSNILI